MLIKTNVPTHDIPPLREPDQNFKFEYDETETSVILNKCFCYISNLDEASKDLPEFEDRCVDFPSQIIVSEQDVRNIVSTLDANKAVGPDIVSNRMSLAVRNKMSKPLCLLFDKFLNDRIFPDQWKFSHVIPLLKSEVRGNCGQVNSDQLENIQIEAAVIVTGLPNYASKNSISKRTRWEY
ncbi:unnamed protein product [Mytilus coruscus]|uniref:Uncharacterized protein n=1 Tax=Mytilus coruscus TaxID=42192 RepID=A0A6J8ECV4_MYTCO|nr:unnamed protein product [Mytilus coruscus]